jgi:methionyl-tRNA synthetase
MAASKPLPNQIVVHSHWTQSQQKMSKSLGNVVDPFEMVGKYGVDAFRYYMIKESRLSGDTGD